MIQITLLDYHLSYCAGLHPSCYAGLPSILLCRIASLLLRWTAIHLAVLDCQIQHSSTFPQVYQDNVAFVSEIFTHFLSSSISFLVNLCSFFLEWIAYAVDIHSVSHSPMEE